MSKWFNARSKRGATLAAAVLLASLAAGCDQIRSLLDRSSGAGASNTTVTGEARVRTSQVVLEPGRGRTLWQAGSETAQEVTGNLRISVRDTRPGSGRPLALAFNKGVVAMLELYTIVPAATASGAGDATFAGLLGADPDTNVFVYTVSREQLSESARGRGLCGGLTATYLAIAEFSDAQGEPTLRIVSFHGDSAPGSLQGEAGFCRLLGYVAG
jgi:hypothetical protein